MLVLLQLGCCNVWHALGSPLGAVAVMVVVGILEGSGSLERSQAGTMGPQSLGCRWSSARGLGEGQAGPKTGLWLQDWAPQFPAGHRGQEAGGRERPA